MVGGRPTDDVNRIEAPVTFKAYLICAFASFGGIFFGYDSGYINGVLGSPIFIRAVEGLNGDGSTPDALSSSHQSLVVSILSAGTFFGAIIAGDVADRIGRKWTVILGCLIYMIGIVIQMITGVGDALAVIVVGRLVAGVGVGFESAIVILYMSEIVSCPPPLPPASAFQTKTDFCPLISAPKPFVALWSQVINSVSQSVSSSPQSSFTSPRTTKIPANTVSQLPFNSSGPLSSQVD